MEWAQSEHDPAECEGSLQRDCHGYERDPCAHELRTMHVQDVPQKLEAYVPRTALVAMPHHPRDGKGL